MGEFPLAPRHRLTEYRCVPSLMDFFGIIVILVIVFGASVLPRVGELIGRRIAGVKREPHAGKSPAPEPAPPEQQPHNG